MNIVSININQLLGVKQWIQGNDYLKEQEQNITKVIEFYE